MQFIEDKTKGQLLLGAGTLYGALTSLEKKGWITPYGDLEKRKKEYCITPQGKEIADCCKTTEELHEWYLIHWTYNR